MSIQLSSIIKLQSIFAICLFLSPIYFVNDLYAEDVKGDGLSYDSTQLQQQPTQPKCGCEMPSDTIINLHKCIKPVKIVRKGCKSSTLSSCGGSCGYEGSPGTQGVKCSFNLACIVGKPVNKITNDDIVGNLE